MDLNQFLGSGAVFAAIALFIIVALFKAVRIVPQSEKYVVERLGRLRSVLGPGIGSARSNSSTDSCWQK